MITTQRKGLSRSISLCHKWKQARGGWMPTCPALHARKEYVRGNVTSSHWQKGMTWGEEQRLAASIDLPTDWNLTREREAGLEA
jgi:hypothetical protein